MILNERATETMSRLMSTPTAKSEILLGKFFGTLVFSVLQFALFAGITHLLFGVDWGGNSLQTAAIGTAYSVAVSGLSMTVAAMVSSEQAADLISGIGIQMLSVLGGSMVPVAFFPDLLRKIALAAPNTWALNSFLEIMTGTTWHALLLPMTVMLALGAVSLTFGTLRLRAR
jgi:ABC-2 type transport system permease protein